MILHSYLGDTQTHIVHYVDFTKKGVSARETHHQKVKLPSKPRITHSKSKKERRATWYLATHLQHLYIIRLAAVVTLKFSGLTQEQAAKK